MAIKKKVTTLKNIFFFPLLTIMFVKKENKHKAFTISDQLSAFLMNLVSTLSVYPVSLKHLAVVLTTQGNASEGIQVVCIFDKLCIAFVLY